MAKLGHGLAQRQHHVLDEAGLQAA